MPRVRLMIVAIFVTACAESATNAPPPRFDVESGNEEELIGGDVYGEAAPFQNTNLGPRARYRLMMVVGPPSSPMYYKSAGTNRWGWFSSQDVNCAAQTEVHDITGDGVADESGAEQHCLPNGEYTIRLEQVSWNPEGTVPTATGVAFDRSIAMLDRNGGQSNDNGPTNYHDVHVVFDLVPSSPTLTGEIRAADYFREMLTSADLYPTGTSFTIAAGDTLWFIATYNTQGSGRPWYGSVSSMLTGFHRDFNIHPELLTGTVNSAPRSGTPSKPYLLIFNGPTAMYSVVGRVTQPWMSSTDSGETRTGQAITVSVVAPQACFTFTGPYIGQATTFNASCSSVYGTPEFRWRFGAGAAWTPWDTSAIEAHTFTTSEEVVVQLEVRRATSTAPVAASSQTLSVGLFPDILGPELITISKSYTWTASATGGQQPYAFTWYYWKPPPAEQQVGTATTYSRYVTVTSTPYTFRLRIGVTDQGGNSDGVYEYIEVVDVGGGGAVPPEQGQRRAIGALDETGACQPLPDERRARQRALHAIAMSGRWPVPCLYWR